MKIQTVENRLLLNERQTETWYAGRDDFRAAVRSKLEKLSKKLPENVSAEALDAWGNSIAWIGGAR